jgi:hypothetical protein
MQYRYVWVDGHDFYVITRGKEWYDSEELCRNMGLSEHIVSSDSYMLVESSCPCLKQIADYDVLHALMNQPCGCILHCDMTSEKEGFDGFTHTTIDDVCVRRAPWFTSPTTKSACIYYFNIPSIGVWFESEMYAIPSAYECHCATSI